MELVEVQTVSAENGLNKFAVNVGKYQFEVSVSDEYYQKLTGGKISPEELIKLSFKFLLEREPAGSILSKFELPIINNYFPEYETSIKQQIY